MNGNGAKRTNNRMKRKKGKQKLKRYAAAYHDGSDQDTITRWRKRKLLKITPRCGILEI